MVDILLQQKFSQLPKHYQKVIENRLYEDISKKALLQDKQEAKDDLTNCIRLIKLGEITLRGYNLAERAAENELQIEIIEAELAYRQIVKRRARKAN